MHSPPPSHSKNVIPFLTLSWFCGAFVTRESSTQASSTKRGGAKSKKFELTEEQKQEIREAFDLFDTDGSGQDTVPLAFPFITFFFFPSIFTLRFFVLCLCFT